MLGDVKLLILSFVKPKRHKTTHLNGSLGWKSRYPLYYFHQKTYARRYLKKSDFIKGVGRKPPRKDKILIELSAIPGRRVLFFRELLFANNNSRLSSILRYDSERWPRIRENLSYVV